MDLGNDDFTISTVEWVSIEKILFQNRVEQNFFFKIDNEKTHIHIYEKDVKPTHGIHK